jgi:hypothetical protein
VGWHVFDEATTALIRRVCRMAGVTVNSFLLKHLTKAIRPSLADQSAVVPWMLPVNLRGKVDLGRDTAMHTTFVSARVKSYETAAEVHRHIYAALARGEHWANWRMYSLVNWLSRSTKRRLIKTGHCYPQWYLGGFSNLGDWDPDKTITQPDCLGDWLFTPLAFRGLAVAAGCVTFQRRLSLTIQVHGSLTTTSAVPQGWVQNWANEIGVELPSMVESSASTAGL